MFNLDISSPRGFGQRGQDGDATEHGTACTIEHLLDLCNSTDAYIKEISTPGGTYKLICTDADNSNTTVFLIAGGVQQVFCLDSNAGPEGFVLPLNLISLWKEHNINVAVIVPPYTMPWGWWAMVPSSKTNQISNRTVLTMPPDSPSIAINMIVRFQEDLHHLLNNFQDQQCWLVGHCSSADMIARYYSVEQVTKPAGLVLWNPPNNTWKITNEVNNMDDLIYFYTKVDVPVLFVQHQQDTCPAGSVEAAKKIFDDCTSPEKKLVILDGGTNQGCPNFSMGYHGFRGIESALVQTTAEFINDHK